MNIDRECTRLDRPVSCDVPRGHLPVLDGLRGLAAFMVIVVHTTITPGPSLADRVVHRVGTLGWVGVDLFFVLSGFLITGILADAVPGRRTMRNFYARRVLRIWPLYLAFLTFCFVVVPAVIGRRVGMGSIGPGDTVAYWLHLGNVVPAMRGSFPGAWLGVTWSLAVEEQFYLIWPAVVILGGRQMARRVAAGAVVAAPLFRLALLGLGGSPEAVYVLTLGRMDALAAGSWVALAARGRGGIGALRPAAGRVLVGAIAGLLSLLIGLAAVRRCWFPFEPAMQCVGFTLLAAAFSAGLVRLLTSPSSGLGQRLLNGGLPRALGKYSYAIYLCHIPVRDLLTAAGWHPGFSPTTVGLRIVEQLAYYTAVTAAAFALAWLSWHLYEKHFLDLKRFFPAHGGNPAPADSNRERYRRDAERRLAMTA
jgi:peptidoglycan/LPS O-acetylase OafA/YrhL